MDIQVEVRKEVDVELPFSLESLLEQAIRTAAALERVNRAEVCISVVDDETIRELNRTYRQKDVPTDVLSFALNETVEGEPEIHYETEEEADASLGDIVISLPTAQRQAQEYGHSLERELAFLTIHGFLHLLGYDHMNEEDEKVMFARQRAILEEMGIARG